MKLVKKQCSKVGFEKYEDFYLEFSHNGKDYKIMVKPLHYGYTRVLSEVAKSE